VKATSTSTQNLSYTPVTAAPAQVVKDVTTVPLSTWNKVGVTSQIPVAKPTVLSGQPPMTINGKSPAMLYYGAEYCPYCAAERWPMVVALSRFGTFSGLATIHSASANGAGNAEPYPNTSTWTFLNAKFSSPYLTFTSVEEQTNIPDKSTGGYTALQKPTAAQSALLAKYDAPPYISSSAAGSIPFVDFGNKYLILGASYSPQVLSGLSWSQIATDLSSPSSPVAKAVDGTANYITAAICKMTGNQPASACTSTVQSLDNGL
jgi:hypothetical protein